MLYLINYGLILSSIVCYVLGSIPNGYYMVKLYCRKDIRTEGSGNVGTLNALKVSKSKRTGFIVLVLDFLKGFVPVVIMLYVFHFQLYFVLVSSIFIVIGHNYPVWLKFKGGRGLAAAAGIFLIFNYGFVVSWLLIYGIIYSIKKDILISNFAATLLLPLLVILFKNLCMPFLNPVINNENYGLFVIFTIIISLLIIIKHKIVLNRLIPFTAKNL